MPTISFSGLASGIDGDAIIDAIIESRKVAKLPLENNVKSNKGESSALEEFNTKLLTLKDALNDFLTLSGGAVSKTATSSNDDAVYATAQSNAISAVSTVTVEQLARAATLSFDDRFTSLDTPLAPGLGAPATIEFVVGSGADAKTYSIDVTSETTLSSLAAAISEGSEERLRVTVINAGSESAPQYLLAVNGAELGVDKGNLTVSVSPDITAQGLFASFSSVQAADARLTLPGIGTVTRPSNTVSDLIPGVTLDLRQANTGPVSITVAQDAAKTATKLQTVVDALNEIIKYSKENSTIEREEGEKEEDVTNVYGILAHTRLDERVVESLKSAVSESRGSDVDSSIQIFADLGVQIKRDGTYEFKQDVFEKAVAKDPTRVNQILNSFSDTLATTDGLISSYTEFQGGIDVAIKANDTENESINEKLERIDRVLDSQTESMKRIFANLEAKISKLNSDQSALSQILVSLSASGPAARG